MAFQIAEAFVEIGSRIGGLEKGLAGARKKLIGFAGMATVAIGNLAAQMTAAFAKFAVSVPLQLASMGSDLQEETNFFNVVLGNNAQAMGDWADSYASAANRSSLATRKMAAEYVDLLVPMGMSKDGSIELSKNLTRLTNDLSSFKNKNPAEVMTDLQAALTGSGEVMKKYGVVLSETTLKQEALDAGLDPKNLSETQKAMLRYNIILKGTTAAHDDALNTADGFANTLRGLTGRLFDLASTIGQALLPGFQRVLNLGTSMMGTMENATGSITSVAEAIGNAIGSAAERVFPRLIEFGRIAIANFKTMLPIFQTVGGVILTVLGTVVGKWLEWYGYISQTIRAAIQFGVRFGDTFNTIAEAASSAFGFIKSSGGSVFSTLWGWIKDTAFAFLNFDLLIKTTGLTIAETFENAVGYVQTFATNAGRLFTWIADNFGAIMRTGVDFVLTLFINLGKNIRSLWQAVLNFIAGKGFNVDFTPLTDGFKSQVSSLPEFKEFVPTDAYKEAFAELDNEWQNRADEWNKTFEDNAVDMGKAYQNELDNVDFGKLSAFNLQGLLAESGDKQKDDSGKDKNSAGSSLGLSAAFDAIQKAAIGDPKDKIAKESLETEKQQLAEQKKTNKMLAKKPGTAVAVYA